ncbi:CsbD family protein [Propionibacteriaceae bacterium Y2011]|uniref:CsbD family protein n=1 Tax=Microlunatus sp. Y2014 TaxID=3418488 RepID=UPI003B484F61
MGVKDSADEAKGRMKEAAGDLTDNEKLQREGAAEKNEAKLRGAADDVKEGFSDAKDRLS